MEELTWRNRKNGKRLFAAGAMTLYKIEFKPKLKHWGVYAQTHVFTNPRGQGFPVWKKQGSAPEFEEAKVLAIAMYRLDG